MNCYTADIVLPIKLRCFFTCVTARVIRFRSMVLLGGGVKFVEDSQINCENVENMCYVLCGRDYRESCAWPWFVTGLILLCLELSLIITLANYDTSLRHV